MAQLGHSPLRLLNRRGDPFDHHPCVLGLVGVARHGPEPVVRVSEAAEKVARALVQLRTDLLERRHPHIERFEGSATLVEIGCRCQHPIRVLPHVIDVHG